MSRRGTEGRLESPWALECFGHGCLGQFAAKSDKWVAVGDAPENKEENRTGEGVRDHLSSSESTMQTARVCGSDK
jgi:hypothetical protein